MSEIDVRRLSGVAETSLIILYIRALESQRPDALIKDKKAEALVRRMDQDFLRKKLARIEDYSRVATILRSREFDRQAREFLARRPDAVVVQIGCGFDTRFDRVDDGRVEWYDLDLPEVMDLHRKLIGGEGPRHHYLACSVFDGAWLEEVRLHHQRSFLFLAEGVFMYFEDPQVKSLVLTLKNHFPSAELVFDAFSPFLVWANNLRVKRTKVGARCHWAMNNCKDLEGWCDGIRLLEEYYPFQGSEPRLGRARWVRYIPFFTKTMGVFRYCIGEKYNTLQNPGDMNAN